MSVQFNVIGALGPRRFFEALDRNALSHAYLFAGAPGVGKKTFARRLAQSLLCTGAGDAAVGYDGTCASCQLFAAENARHPDFLEHAGVLKIGDRDSAAGFYDGDELSARDLVRQLSMQSYSGGMRVLLLGDVDFATHHAANALLKFLEEPPRGVLMLLTSATPGRLLPTIRSRLVEVRFPFLSRSEVAQVLARLGYASDEAERGAALGGGSATRAVAALGGEEESLRAQVARWFFDCAAGKPVEPWATRETLDEGLETIKSLLRDWIAVAAAPQAAPSFAGAADTLRALPPLTNDAALDLLATIDRAQRLARTNVQPAMVGEIVRMTLTGKATRSV